MRLARGQEKTFGIARLTSGGARKLDGGKEWNQGRADEMKGAEMAERSLKASDRRYFIKSRMRGILLDDADSLAAD